MVYISRPLVSNSRPDVSISRPTVPFRDIWSDFEVLARLAAHRRLSNAKGHEVN